MSDQVHEWIAEHNEEALTADGFDAAIVGVAERCSQPTLVVYDAEQCLQILMDSGLGYDEAMDYFCYNVAGAWHGEHTPLFLWRWPGRS